jgi:acyl-CoA hydrolase
VRTVDVDSLARHLPPLPAQPRLVTSGNFATPYELVAALDRALPAYRLHLLNAHGPLPDRDGVRHETAFVGPAMRRRPRLDYVPTRLSLLPALYRRTLPPDAVVVHTSTPRDGRLSLGVEVNVLPAAIEAVRARGGPLIAQVNPQVPFVEGDGVLDVDDVDLAVEVDVALPSPQATPLDDAARAIGEAVAARVPDGATMQLGIGAVPDATLHGVLARRGLRIWSEMLGDGVLALDRAGALDPAAPITASFMFGSEELYRWVDGNPRVRLLRTEVVNEPARIAANPQVVSVNTALQVDLFAQANASRIGARIHSGFGGQTDFIVGALHSDGGQALLALRSWHPRADVSTVVPLVDEPVTSFQPTAVITEQGTAEVFGHTERDQARNLIERAAHPDVRAELREEAVALRLL